MCLPAWFLAGKLAQQVKLPLITGYLIAGAVSGPSLLQLFRANGLASLGFVDHACLGVIALAAGAELRVSELRKTKRQVSNDLDLISEMIYTNIRLPSLPCCVAGHMHHSGHFAAILAVCLYGDDDANALHSLHATPHTSATTSCG